MLLVMACLSGASPVAVAQEKPEDTPEKTVEEILDRPAPKFTLPDFSAKPVNTDKKEKVRIVKRNLKGIDPNSRLRKPIILGKAVILPEVTYFDPPEITVLSEQFDSLLFGILTDLPPEYDLYGYEVRRYMSGIYSEAVFTDKIELKQQLYNIRRAKIVLSYWEDQPKHERGRALCRADA